MGRDAAEKIAASAAYGISATANHFFPIKSGAPPSCLNWTVIRHTRCGDTLPGVDPDVIQVTDRKMERVHKVVRIAKHKATVGSVK
jgi:hypothetical protein